MPERRSKGDDAIYFEHDGPCKDSTRHRRCPGRWRGEITTGRSPEGRRLRRRVSGASKAAVQDALKDLRREIDGGIRAAAPHYTVRRCCEDWLADGLPGRDPKTIEKNRYVLEPLLTVIGTVRLRDLDVTDVDKALAAVAATRSSSTVAMAHLSLTRAITRAQAKNLVLRNVSALTGTPLGQQGRPSRSMTLAEATALTAAAEAAGRRTHAYVMLSLCTGVRTEEARALRWEHVDLGDPASVPPRPASVAVWRSVRAKGDTKTMTSRRTLALPDLALTALQALHDATEPEPGNLVFATATGKPLDAANVRRFFRAVCTAAGIGPGWTPRELRHTFVSLMSDSDVAVEEIARLVGHASSKVTETVYRHQLRPVMTTGAEKMDALLGKAG
ncbi:MAG: tyrosine-type recombinase/integrase [Streptosporangiaceae bacterium]